MKKIEQLQSEASGVTVSTDPKKAALELRALGIMEVAKKEGIQ